VLLCTLCDVISVVAEFMVSMLHGPPSVLCVAIYSGKMSAKVAPMARGGLLDRLQASIRAEQRASILECKILFTIEDRATPHKPAKVGSNVAAMLTVEGHWVEFPAGPLVSSVMHSQEGEEGVCVGGGVSKCKCV
jgi:hypothetical protein